MEDELKKLTKTPIDKVKRKKTPKRANLEDKNTKPKQNNELSYRENDFYAKKNKRTVRLTRRKPKQDKYHKLVRKIKSKTRNSKINKLQKKVKDKLKKKGLLPKPKKNTMGPTPQQQYDIDRPDYGLLQYLADQFINEQIKYNMNSQEVIDKLLKENAIKTVISSSNHLIYTWDNIRGSSGDISQMDFLDQYANLITRQ